MSSLITIKSNEDFQDIFKKGHSINGRFIVVYFVNNSSIISRFGYCAGRKIGNAVIRNRIKRLLREAVHFLHHLIIPGFDVIIIAKSPIITASLQSIINEFGYILKKAGLDSTKKLKIFEDSL